MKIKDNNDIPFFSFYLGGLIDRALSSTTKKQIFDIKQEEIDFVDQLFGAYSAWSQTNNVPIIINALTLLPDNGNFAIIQALAAKHNLPITDSYGKINHEQLADYTISKLDHHPNAKAHKQYANSLLEFDAYQQVLEACAQRLAD